MLKGTLHSIMNVILVTGHQYPVGTALTNRIRSYLEVLVTIGHEVSVVIYRPSETSENVLNCRSGKLNGVNYCSSAYSIVRPKNPLLSRIVRFYSYLNCVRIILRENKVKHIDVIIQASAKSSMIPLLYIICNINKTAFVLENSEYPWFILKEGKLSNGFYKLLYLELYYKLFDGVLAMTKALQKYHTLHSRKGAQIIHLPMTVDISRFSLSINRENYITYIGNMSYAKDGVEILTYAFIQIADRFPDWKLRIVGDTGKDDSIRLLAIERGLSERIEVLGQLHRDKVPQLLCSSKVLALARPCNMQSEGGFPTKLGEYLATGNLVVVTSVGEIPDYLEDGFSAVLAEHGSIDKFSEKLAFAISEYNSLTIVRANGYQVCKEVFNSSIQGSRLSDYLIQLSIQKKH